MLQHSFDQLQALTILSQSNHLKTKIQISAILTGQLVNLIGQIAIKNFTQRYRMM